jgi:hypothetical protein
MSRFNTAGHKAKPEVVTVSSPLRTAQGPADTRTFEGGAGWTKDWRTDLFLRSSASFTDGSDKFYEKGYERDAKLRALARQAAVEDFVWFAQFVKWLRRTAYIRTAALMIAADGVKARLEAGHVAVGELSSRKVIDSVLYRADEPGELLAYWMHQYGRKVPKPVKRGVADAVQRLYNERSLLKYDTASHGVRFGDVLNLVHAEPSPDKPWQGELFKYSLDRRHNPDTAVPHEALRTVVANRSFRERVQDAPYLAYSPEALNEAALTWEDALSLSGQLGIDKQRVWEAMIPSMGYMALLRNLRNFDEAGVSDEVADQIIAKLTDPGEVAKSRQLPFRFYSAYLHAPSLRWARALEKALDLCVPNIAELDGRTLVLTDTSASMTSLMSGKSKLQCLEAAGLFASAFSHRNAGRVDLYQYADFPAEMVVPKGGSVLRTTEAIRQHANRVGWGTNIEGSVRQAYKGHDRVIIFSDGQGVWRKSAQGVGGAVPAHVPVYLFNVEGYSASPMPTGTAARFDLGGLSDQTFKMIPLLESGKGAWPWEVSDAA